jgi:hypothetical protein
MAGGVVEEGLDGRDVDQRGNTEQHCGAGDKTNPEPPEVVILVMMCGGNHLENSLFSNRVALFDINVNNI